MRSVVTVYPIGSQVSGVPFVVSGTINYYPTIDVSDDGVNFDDANVGGSALSTSTWHFTHQGMPVGNYTFRFESGDGSSGVVTSNPFAVVNPHTITPNAPTGAVEGAPFIFTGSLGNYAQPPNLTAAIDSGTPFALSGVSASGWNTTLTIETSGTHTLTVSDGTLSTTTAAFSVAASGVAPPPPVSGVVWDATHKSSTIVLSNGSGTATSSGTGAQSVLATVPVPASGFAAWEVIASAVTTDWAAGVADRSYALDFGGGLGGDQHGAGYYINSPPEETWYNGTLVNGSSGTDSTGAAISFVASGLQLWVSTPEMRANGFNFNNSTTADPATGVGGINVSGIGLPFYPAFNVLETGASATINGGASGAFSAFLTTYMAAHTAIKALDGTIVSGGGSSGVPAVHTITPVSPGTVTAGQAFTFHGTISGYGGTAPTLLYEVDNGSPALVSGVTASGWSMTLNLSVLGSHTLLVTDGAVSGSTTVVVQAASGTGGGGANGIPRVTAPLTGTVTKGTWLQNQRLNVAAMPHGFIAYDLLLPAQYDPSLVYPIMVYGHENDEGMNGGSYPSSNLATENGAVGPGLSADSCFNTVAFRTAFPCIVVVPYCDQSLDTSGANPNANFGGYADTPDSGGNEQGVLALVRFLQSTYSVDATRIYITGDSLGAIGALAQMVDNNAYGTGTVNHVFAAGMGFSDQLYRPTISGGSNSPVIQAMKNVPYLAIGTPDDNNEAIYDQAAWQAYTGGASYPTAANYTSGGVAALNAPGTQFYYLHDANDVPWNDGYRQLDADGGKGTALYTWLFDQIVSGVSVGTVPAPAASAGYHTITYGPTIVLGKTADPVTSFPEFSGSVNWVPFTFYGTSWASIGAVQNADGSVTLDGTGQTFGNGLATAAAGDANLTSDRLSFTGTAFGGGFYVEAVMKGDGPMSFWANDIETMNGVSVNAGPNAWAGQVSGYGDWIEADIAEFDTTGSYGIALHNWYGAVGSNNDVNTGFAKVAPSPTPDYTQYHTYGALWVPATVSGHGSFKFYFDGTEVAEVTWDQFNAALTPPPTAQASVTSGVPQTAGGLTAFGVMDNLHLALIMGAGSGSTVTFKSVTVWQRDASKNLAPSGTIIPPPSGESRDGTIVNGTTGQLIDSQNNVWAINAGGVITVNGTPDNTTGNVLRLVYSNHTIWQQNADLMWWNKTSAGASWTPATGTSTSPLSNAAPSSNKATITAPTATVLTDVSGNAYGINSGQVMVNGTADSSTSNVVELAYVAGVMWQETASGVWYGKSSPTAAWSPSGGTTTSPLASGSGGGGTPTGQFHISGGKIIDPNGKVFIAAGVNIYDTDLAGAITGPDCNPLLSTFPGCNFVRVPVYAYQDPSFFAQQIAWATAKGIVIELEDHTNTSGGNAGGNDQGGVIFSGSRLTQELNWYASCAAYYANNPYVWFGTDNEPATKTNASGSSDPNALSSWQQQTYNAVRNAGSDAIVMIEAVGWDTPQSYGQYITPSYFTGMTNAIIDMHVYGEAYSGTTASNIASVINENIAYIQGNQTSADGVMPVLIGEFGNATDGQHFDSNGAATVTAVTQVAGANSAGFAAWNWQPGNGDIDALRNGNGSLTDYGQQIATGIAAAAANRS